jgi:hypothetical protein
MLSKIAMLLQKTSYTGTVATEISKMAKALFTAPQRVTKTPAWLLLALC